ncbi:MAG: alpha/beta hydrolase [Myxococcales bacterium]|nr:alpha/beta hydrolase [Myxococcales bacterium]
MSDLLVCFHGSPGLPDEFEGLAESLPGVEVRAVVRYGYPSFRQYPRQGDLDERCIVVGYSFGCVAALKAAAYRPKNVEAAILIAPYLFVERPLGALKRALLATPGISTLLLRSAGPKAIAEMLTKSSHPQPVPADYQRVSDRLSRPEVLHRSMVEKDHHDTPTDANLRQLRINEVPIVAIWGAEDQTSSEAAQIEPIRPYLTEEHRLEAAGHALVWTHVPAIAAIVKGFIETNGTGAAT